MADLGCGSGVSTLAMARRCPDSRFVGYDIVAEGMAAVAREGVDLPNARFEVHSIMELPAASFDFVLCFDVLHDLSDPLSALSSIRGSLKPGGLVPIVEPSASSSLEANLDHPLGALFYGISTFYCLPNSTAGGGSGFGTAWGRERAEEAAREAGFRSFEMLGIPNPFNALYLVS